MYMLSHVMDNTVSDIIQHAEKIGATAFRALFRNKKAFRFEQVWFLIVLSVDSTSNRRCSRHLRREWKHGLQERVWKDGNTGYGNPAYEIGYGKTAVPGVETRSTKPGMETRPIESGMETTY